MNPSDYPRLLLVTGSAFNPITGGGITFTNLFREWPKEKIATAHTESLPLSTDICDRYYRLGPKEFPVQFPFSLLGSALGGMSSGGSALSHASGGPPSILSRLIPHLWPWARRLIGEEIPTRASVSPALREWITDFQPQVIYTILGSLPYIRLVEGIASEFDLPIVVHMMDDWPAVSYRQGLWDWSRRRAMERELPALFKRSSQCLAISGAMKEVYEQRYGVTFYPFSNALDIEPWLAGSRKQWTGGNPFVLLYAGALIANSQLDSVRETALAVAQLVDQGFPIEFHIYASTASIERFRSLLVVDSAIHLFPAPESMDIVKLFASADLLLLPVNFDEDSIQYIRYSMPTKVPTYMLSGTPTLAYGPIGVASIAYARAWAQCVLERNVRAVADAIRTMIGNEDLRRTTALTAIEIARERHDAQRVRPVFHRIFADVVSMKRI